MTVERAIAALKTGRPVRVEGTGVVAALSVEMTTSEILELVDPKNSARLLLSGQRAAALNLANIREAADPARPVLIERPTWLDAETAREVVDPGRDFERSPLGPLHPVRLELERESVAALALARRAGLLPALWILDESAQPIPSITVEEIEAAAPRVTLVSRAKLPLEGLPSVQIVAFRASDDGQEHVALVVGAFHGKPPLVRLHSECLTGDVFGSLRCDCGPQLKEALRVIAGSGGILLYLRQEGRGIGLVNKLRAYALQDRGLDTVEANLRIGFDDDERDYAHAAAMLRALGLEEVRLLTNNPSKVEGLEKAGIGVVERVGHQMPPNPHNVEYLATKRLKSGHLL